MSKAKRVDLNVFSDELESEFIDYGRRIEILESGDTKPTLANIKVFSASDYGIHADGVTDVSSKLQLLIDELPNGSTLLIPSSDEEYVCSSSLNITNRQNITIKGLGGIVKLKNGINSNIATFICSGSNNIKFEDISVNVDRQNQDSSLYPQYVNTAFYISDTNNVTLNNIEMINSTRELKIIDCTNVYIDGLYVNDVLIDGISLDNCVGGIVKNVIIENVLDSDLVTSANAVEVEDGTRNMKFYNIYCDNIRNTGFKIQTHMGIDIACNNILVDGLEVHNSGSAFQTNNWNYDIKVKNVKGRYLSGYVMKLYEVTDTEVDGFDLKGNMGIMTTRVDDLIFKNGKIDIDNSNQNSAGIFIQARHVNILYENIDIVTSQQSFVTLEAFEELEDVIVRNCNIESRNNSPVWLSGNWNTLRFESCNIKIPSGTRRVILDTVNGVEFINCNILSKSTMAISIREGCQNISVLGGNIVSADSGILIGVQRSSNNPFSDINIDNINFTCPNHSVHLRGLPTGEIMNVKVSNCIMKGVYAVYFDGSSNINTVTIANNIGKDTLTKNEFGGFKLVESGNNFADTL